MEMRSEEYKGFRITVGDWFRSEGSGPTRCGYCCAVCHLDGHIADLFEGPNSSRLFNSTDEAMGYAKSQIDAGKLESRAMTNTPETPAVLYHYCGVSGFRGILGSKSLWMSDACTLNDSTEHKLILDPAVKQLGALAAKEATNRRFCERAIKSLLDLSSLHPYVACFSSEPDLLSQWRAYADDGAGFAIGFSGDGIDNRWTLRMDTLTTLRKVEYDPCKQETRLRETIAKCLSRYLKRYPCQDTADPYEGLEIATAHADLWDLAAVCKHHGFCEEKEYRLVRMPRGSDLRALGLPITDVGSSEICFRVSGDRKVPYFAFAFQAKDIVELRLGPKNRERGSLATFLRENGYDVDRIKIIPSDIPYC